MVWFARRVSIIRRVNHIDSLLTLQALEHLPRTGWCQSGITTPESIAAHTLGVAQVALALMPEVEPKLDTGQVLSMALVHDAPEALIGDFPLAASRLLPAGAKRQAERAAAAELLDASSLEAFHEFLAGETREARFVKLCDKLQLGLRLLAYRRAGRDGLLEFERGIRNLDASEFTAAEVLRKQLLTELDAQA